MTFTYDEATISSRASAALAWLGDEPRPEHFDGAIPDQGPADHAAFRQALERIVGGSAEKGACTPHRLMMVYVQPKTAFREFWMEQARARERIARDEVMRSTYLIKTMGKSGDRLYERRIPRDQESAWLRRGEVMHEHHPDVIAPNDDGADNLSFSNKFAVRSYHVGAELRAGTVKAKRLIYKDQGLRVQYRVKPRGAKAEIAYKLRIERDDIRLAIDADPDQPDDLRAQRTARLAAIEAELLILRPKAKSKAKSHRGT